MKTLAAVVVAYLYGCHVGLREGRAAGKRIAYKEAADWTMV